MTLRRLLQVHSANEWLLHWYARQMNGRVNETVRKWKRLLNEFRQASFTAKVSRQLRVEKGAVIDESFEDYVAEYNPLFIMDICIISNKAKQKLLLIRNSRFKRRLCAARWLAVTNKWVRAESAIKNGIDAVFDTVYACLGNASVYRLRQLNSLITGFYRRYIIWVANQAI